MRLIAQYAWMPIMFWFGAICAAGESYPSVKSFERTFIVPDVRKANVVTEIRSTQGTPLYKLQCHSAGYTGDPEFDYSGNFECRLSLVAGRNTYSTLLTEDRNQSRDWESRGRFFADDLRGKCAQLPQFGAVRSFELRGLTLTLRITNPTFTHDGELRSLHLTVIVDPNPDARSSIAKSTPLPQTGVPAECRLSEYFVDPATFSK